VPLMIRKYCRLVETTRREDTHIFSTLEIIARPRQRHFSVRLWVTNA